MNDRRRYKAWNANTASESSMKKLEIAIQLTARRKLRNQLVSKGLSIENQSNKKFRVFRIQISHSRVSISVSDSLPEKPIQTINCSSSNFQFDKVKLTQRKYRPALQDLHNMAQLGLKPQLKYRHQESWASPINQARPRRPILQKQAITVSLPEIATTLM